MTRQELEQLFVTSCTRQNELMEKYQSGQGLTRQDCIEMREATQRIALVAKELFLLAGSPDGEEWELLRQPMPPLRPLPTNFSESLDLTNELPRGGLQ